MTQSQQRLFQRMNRNSSSMELVPGGNVSTNNNINASISQIVGNPAFKAEVSLQVTTRYYSQAVVGTPAPVVPPAGQQNPFDQYDKQKSEESDPIWGATKKWLREKELIK